MPCFYCIKKHRTKCTVLKAVIKISQLCKEAKQGDEHA